jgi:hypothetical protein
MECSAWILYAVKEISFVNAILAAKESGIRVFKKMGKVDCSCSRREDTNIACPTSCTANQARGTKDE